MKNQLVICIFLFLGFLSNAQVSGENNSIEFSFGSSYFQRERVFKQNLSEYLESDFDKLNLMYGITLYKLGDKKKDKKLASEYGFFYHHPVLLKVNGADIKYLGYHYSAASGVDIFKKNRKFDFILMGGYNWGRKTLIVESFQKEKYRNVFFAPKFSSHLRLLVGALALSLKFEAQFDLTDPSWKIKDGIKATPVHNFKFNGYFFSFGIGHTFFKPKEEKFKNKFTSASQLFENLQ